MLLLWKSARALLALAFLSACAVPAARAQTISSFYSIAGSPEAISAPFLSSSGAMTTTLFTGFVEIQVSGTGYANGPGLNDAFYYLPGQTGPGGKQLSPPGMAVPASPLYQLGLGTAAHPFVGAAAQTDIQKYIVFIGGRGPVSAGTIPDYSPSHVYEFVIAVPDAALTPLTFGALDNVYHDNGGSFTVTATQLSAAPVPEASSVIAFGLLLVLGIGGLAVSRRRIISARGRAKAAA